jgi:hypothetical protein
VFREYVVDSWRSVQLDVFFVAGRDWLMLEQHLDARTSIPVGLVQYVHNALERVIYLYIFMFGPR